jgi:hypothetical protein
MSVVPLTVWNVPIVTDQTVLANWPDIVLHDKSRRCAS